MTNAIPLPLRQLYRTVMRRSAPAPVGGLAYLEADNQWYRPLLAGVSSIPPHVCGAAAVRRSLDVLDRLECDAYHTYVMNFYRAGLARVGEAWAYADLYTTLSGLARLLQPASYLEIGVRRGHSMAMVASQAPGCEIFGFDLWIDNYAGLPNPGKDFVRQQLARVGYAGSAHFVDGDSAETVPAFLRTRPDLFFDLVTVDGDHSLRGARRDLRHVLSRLKIGGMVVFDDLVNAAHPDLRQVWDETVTSNPRFSTWTFDEAGYGVAVGIRIG